eukprot:TRINITY_DN3355_c1_g3_i1.p1 TRINITY_DN3355_c1_g3~~TRINITY_DN3355_c1_g3_i1.p1  ORF type:complete len:1242 (+),score=268.26 TRINITY_DN3355_c1_g3_i1:60-3785(+)
MKAAIITVSVLCGLQGVMPQNTSTETLTLTETLGTPTETMTATASHTMTETMTLRTETETLFVYGEVQVPEYLPSVFFNPEKAEVLSLNFTVSITDPQQEYQGITVTPAASLAVFTPTTYSFVSGGPKTATFIMYGVLIGIDNVRWTLTPYNNSEVDVQKFKRIGSTAIDIQPRIHFADLVESSGTWVSYEYSKGEYPDVLSEPLLFELLSRPIMGLEVSFDDLSNGTSGITFTPPTLSFSTFVQTQEVRITCTTPGEYLIKTILGGSDSPLMYANQPQWYHKCLEPVVTTLTYTGMPPFEENDSELFMITPQSQHRDYQGFDLRFQCVSQPVGLTFDPAVVVISAQSGAGFTINGPTGEYNLTCSTYTYTEDGNKKGVDNPGFVDPNAFNFLEVIDRNTITIPNIPVLRMITDPIDSIYGGAYSPVLECRLSVAPRVELVITPAGDGLEFSPSKLTFGPSDTVLTFRVRGTVLAAGVTVSFTYSGTNALNYLPVADKSVTVTGPSPACSGKGSKVSCVELWDDGCWWDGATCRNDDVGISFIPSAPPAQYHNEPVPFIVNLGTEVVNGMVLKLSGLGLTYGEDELVFAPGESASAFTVSGVVADDATTRWNMIFDLSGADFNHFTRPPQQQLVILNLLQVSPPSTQEYPFLYIESTSSVLYVTLELPATRGVTLTPSVSGPGSLVFDPPVLTYAAGESSKGFTISTGGETGTYNVTWTTGGTDVAKYVREQWGLVKVFTRIEIHATPLPTLADEEWSPLQYVQMETAPIDNIDITITAVSPSNTDHTFSPAVVQVTAPHLPVEPATSSITLTFTPEMRTLGYKVRGMTPGFYGIEFSLGPHRENFSAPGMRDFWVAEAAVWDYTRGQNGVDPKCRVAVGRIGYASTKIQDVSQETCSINDILDATTLCQVGSKKECDNELRNNGRPCVWIQAEGACKFGLPNGNVTHYSVGESHSMFRMLDGGLWSAGSNTFGQLGHTCNGVAGCSDSVEYKEVMFEDLDDDGNCKQRLQDGSCVMIPATQLTNYGVLDYVTGIVTGSSHSMALTVSGRLYSWGANNHGQLGVPTLRQMEPTPRRVNIPERPLVETITCIAGGAYHSVAISDLGKVYVWGWNYFGQLGHTESYREALRTPVLITDTVPAWASDEPVSISAGDYHTVVGTKEGHIYTFGRNNYGQLARVTEFNSPEPTLLSNDAPPAVFHGGASTRPWGCKEEDKVNYESWPVGTDFTLGRAELSVYAKQR